MRFVAYTELVILARVVLGALLYAPNPSSAVLLDERL
jgi:hypothetical protein